MKKRGFEIARGYEGAGIRLPARKTAMSAGYDIEAASDATLAPGAVTLVPTGLKAYMPPDEYLGLFVRSGLSVRQNVSCVNGVGVIDADYCGNEENDGHIMVALINNGKEPVEIKKGERIVQGIFCKYMTVDGDEPGKGGPRSGGMGSTGG